MNKDAFTVPALAAAFVASRAAVAVVVSALAGASGITTNKLDTSAVIADKPILFRKLLFIKFSP